VKFKSEDFCFDMEDHDAGLKYLAHVASHMANARLEQMLAEAPVVFNQKIGELKQENAALREALKRLLSEAEQMHLAHRSMRKKAEERAEILEKKLAALVKDREAGFAVVETLNSEVNRLTGENAALKEKASGYAFLAANYAGLLREARDRLFWLSTVKHEFEATVELSNRIDAALGDKND